MNSPGKPNGSFAEMYLFRCNEESKPHDEIDIHVFKRLSELDTKLGTTAFEQLYRCLYHTTRWDIIKVRLYDLNISFLTILDHRF